jgi:outer membrane lipoprotein-sorting protein
LLLMMLAAIAAAGCSLVASPPNPAPSAVSAPSESSHARDLAAALVERNRELVSMQAGAIMEYREADRHVKAREQILVRRPADLRVEVDSPFGLALVVAANDSHLEIFEPSNDTLYQGGASAESLNRFAQIPLAPKPAVNLLMGLAPGGEQFVRPPDTVSTEGALLIAAYKSADGSVIELGFEDTRLAMVRERGAGAIRYEVRYSDYRDIGGFQFAHRIEADFPPAHTHVNFTLQRPIINGTLADSLFALKPGPATKLVNLDRAGASSAAADVHG